MMNALSPLSGFLQEQMARGARRIDTMIKTRNGALVGAVGLMLWTGVAVAQTPGGTCPSFGAAQPYETNGVLVCSRSGHWTTLLPASPASSFGQNSQIVSTAGERLTNGIKIIINGIRTEVENIMN
jgi:hypothetical protein